MGEWEGEQVGGGVEGGRGYGSGGLSSSARQETVEKGKFVVHIVDMEGISLRSYFSANKSCD